MKNIIKFGDCRNIMRVWKNQGIEVQTCVTSPPYFGLRDYGIDGQLGLEKTVGEFVQNLVEVFRCVWDILKEDGTVWLNLGDSYVNSGLTKSDNHGYRDGRKNREKRLRCLGAKDLKTKDLIGIPWHVAFALQADGWYLRQDIIWHKPNPMPESVTDRCTKSHEYIFLLSKNKKYYYDNEAIKERLSQASIERMAQDIESQIGSERGNGGQKTNGNMKAVGSLEYGMRNKRSVWEIATKPYSEAHFATFPPALILPCILAGTSQEGECPECGKAWKRIIEKKRIRRNEFEKSDPRYRPNLYSGSYEDINGKGDAGYSSTETIGWKKDCECQEHEPVPQLVLDPFMGSGTTAMVAKENGREYLGCELNQDNEALQKKRIASVQYQRKLF